MAGLSARSPKPIQAGCVAVAMLAAIAPARAATERVVYAFPSFDKGSGPFGLIAVGAKLYGTTVRGGTTSANCPQYVGCGTVFEIGKAGQGKTLYRFQGGSDGAIPVAGLIHVGGTLYGTTEFGGTGPCNNSLIDEPNGCGTAFSITPSGTETTLYSFQNSPDGANPGGALLNVGGTFYGTTIEGGPTNNGTVFSLTPSGTETILHAFKGSGRDGAFPLGELVKLHGALYGTTEGGGTKQVGTVFSVTPSAKETTVFSFRSKGSAPDYPEAALVNVDGTLYGTTDSGGAHGMGAVFSITPAGTLTTVYSFHGTSDGAFPRAALINVGGTLYGTASFGGSSDLGTVFSVTPSGTETTLHSFTGGADGANPLTPVINVGGNLYGTTVGGGTTGNGTVFEVIP